MKKIYSILFASLIAAGFTSCEMKDELWGKEKDSAEVGVLQLNLSNNAQQNLVRNIAGDNGNKPGTFDPEELNISNYTLEVVDINTNQTVMSGTLAALGGANNSVSLTLDKGKYSVKAYNYDGSAATASARPYFMGSQQVEILPGNTTNTPITCSLQNIEVSVSLAESFKTSFKDDYEIMVDNGEGAIQRFDKNNINTRYFLATPAGKNSLTVSVKATTVANGSFPERDIQRTYTVTKPENAEGNSMLAAGDAFIINLKEDGSSASYIDFGISVDFSFAEQEEIIGIPTENITFKDNGGTVDPPVGEDPITFTGLPVEYSDPAENNPEGVVVTIDAAEGIENLFVNITTDNKGFGDTIAGFGLGEEFDIANPGDLEPILTGSLDSGDGIGLLKPGEVIKGQTHYVFDVTSFMSLLPLYGKNHCIFSIRVVDAKGNTLSGDLKVTITKDFGE